MSQLEVLRDTVIAEVILPALMKLEEETGQPIKVRVSVRSGQSLMIQEICTRPTECDAAATGEARVVLKEIGPTSINIAAESILHGLAPESGFSGFSLRGKLEFSGGRWSARLTAHTNRYNVWDWRKEFAQ